MFIWYPLRKWALPKSTKGIKLWWVVRWTALRLTLGIWPAQLTPCALQEQNEHWAVFKTSSFIGPDLALTDMLAWNKGDMFLTNSSSLTNDSWLIEYCLVVWNMFFPIQGWEFHHPNWRFVIFFRGVASTTSVSNDCFRGCHHRIIVQKHDFGTPHENRSWAKANTFLALVMIYHFFAITCTFEIDNICTYIYIYIRPHWNHG